MNKSSFIIISETISDTLQMGQFTEAITSQFVTKRAREQSFLIVSEGKDAKEIFQMIESKMTSKINFLVVEFENFYGYFIDDSVADWLRTHFPKFDIQT
jgi:hypothetical protein